MSLDISGSSPKASRSGGPLKCLSLARGVDAYIHPDARADLALDLPTVFLVSEELGRKCLPTKPAERRSSQAMAHPQTMKHPSISPTKCS